MADSTFFTQRWADLFASMADSTFFTQRWADLFAQLPMVYTCECILIAMIPVIVYYIAVGCRSQIDAYPWMGYLNRKEHKRCLSLVTTWIAYVYWTQVSCMLVGHNATLKAEVLPVLRNLEKVVSSVKSLVGALVFIVSWVLHAYEPTEKWLILLAKCTDAVAKVLFLSALSLNHTSTPGEKPGVMQISEITFAGFQVAVLFASEAMFLVNPVSALMAMFYDPWKRYRDARLEKQSGLYALVVVALKLSPLLLAFYNSYNTSIQTCWARPVNTDGGSSSLLNLISLF